MDRPTTSERSDERGETTCPQVRPVGAMGRYPVDGYCILARWLGFLLPTMAEHRDHCTTGRYAECGYRERGMRAAPGEGFEEFARAA